jgi:hypothetical protein
VQADGPVFELFDEWAASLARGERPDPAAFLDRAGDKADELADLMDAFLQAAPRGEPTDETLLLARAWIAGSSPLVELRASRGVRRDDVIDAVVEEFAIAPDRREKVRRYYHELESGLLDPTGLDRRMVDVIARTLSSSRAAIVGLRPRAIAASPAFRAAAGHAPAETHSYAPAPEPPDEVDRLFRGGDER